MKLGIKHIMDNYEHMDRLLSPIFDGIKDEEIICKVCENSWAYSSTPTFDFGAYSKLGFHEQVGFINGLLEVRRDPNEEISVLTKNLRHAAVRYSIQDVCDHCGTPIIMRLIDTCEAGDILKAIDEVEGILRHYEEEA